MSKGKIIKSILVRLRELKPILTDTLVMSTIEFIMLLTNAPLSDLFFANIAIYRVIIPYKYNIPTMIIDNISKNQPSLYVSYRYYL